MGSNLVTTIKRMIYYETGQHVEDDFVDAIIDLIEQAE